ncbi:MAG: heavy metal translocating P-type ATPase [Liquorilactobacillus ghanensis]|uniref:heavy metal translocating P-type ATPase n=1 Tax=Liquorilactobacillus ghanensis TaxID=399370 RepID=UPI0039EB8B36
MKQEQYQIGGMVCASCAQTVERAVNCLPGVAQANVNLATEKMRVAYDTGKLKPAQIVAAVEQAGYQAQLQQSAAENEKKVQQQKKQQQMTMRNKLIGAILFAVSVLYLAMAPMAGLPLPNSLAASPLKLALAELVLTLPVFWFGRDHWIGGFRSLLRGHPNMDSLVALGTWSSLLASVANTIRLVVTNHEQYLYYETAALILALIMLGKYLEFVAKQRAAASLTSLLQLVPPQAELLQNDGTCKSVSLTEIKPGDRLLVKSGQRIPTDGVVLTGQTTIDEAMLTGESLPVTKNSGDKVIGGTQNQLGQITMQVSQVGEKTVLAQIVKLVSDAQATKAPIARLADQVAAYFVPIILGIAALGLLGWLLAGQSFEFALQIFVAVLVIACPCALGLATPTALMVGSGKGAENGILFKNSPALEQLARLTTVVFDKTGTLTQGNPAVISLTANAKITTDQLLQIAASLEQNTNHPLATAILKKAEGKPLLPVREFKTWPGLGVSGILAGQKYYLGSQKLLEQQGVFNGELKDTSAGQETTVFIADQTQVIGLMGIADQLRPEAAEVIQRLQQLGLKTVLLTGDKQAIAQKTAAQLQIGEVVSEVLPAQKAAVIQQLQQKGQQVAMVGDGINDAPALAQADVGIAIGNGTNIAVDSADIVLMHSNLHELLQAVILSKKTLKNIKENLFWAFAYNTLGIPIALGGWYLLGGPLLNPALAGAAMSFSSVSVVLNALRLRHVKLA